jgi:hypothetical protein
VASYVACWKRAAIVWGVLSAIMLLLDYVGVRLIHFDGVFIGFHITCMGMDLNVDCMSLGFLVALPAFLSVFYFSDGGLPFSQAFGLAIVLAIAWCWFVLLIVLGWFHVAIGGQLRI